ncbi:hypothetical protein N657DRAFT_379583 [Parathielavia appendiculata]|uniref:Uncharacterized protein n=1 Tax=Parathielavia appendiculata TaxID=2587402 RepID=A0AAN6U0H1_9PEZI|nr:hypothetical protein N657DRAFT_379583 [Parathielavia appendiculata]
MASSGLPPGAFLTTIEGRRCTAVPRVAAALSSSSSATSSVSRVTTTASLARTTPAIQTTALAAAPAAEIDTFIEQSPTSTTSSSFITTTSTSPSPVRIIQAQDSEPDPPASPPPPLPAGLPLTSGVTPQSFTAVADAASPRVSVPQSSQADGSVTAPITGTLAGESEGPPAETSAPDLPQEPAATPLLTTVGAPQTPADSPVPKATGTTSADPSVAAIPTLNNNAVQSTVAVAGGVIGGVIAISLLAFFIWWWRRRLQRKRRSTLLTPLDTVPSFDRGEKGGYVIARRSIGPTPVTEKFKAALGQNFKRLRGHIRNRTAPSVNLDRGTSQFVDAARAQRREISSDIGAELTVKDRLRNWLVGLGMKFSQGNNNAQERNPSVTNEKKAASSSQPDFLTLVNMSDQELDREAQRQRASIARANGSASDSFLGKLNLNFGNDNPFSDANAIAHISAKPAPLAIGNRFSDSNTILESPRAAMPKPATYVADIRRSRSNSIATSTVGARRQPSAVYNYSAGAIRDSTTSLGSMATATTAGNQRTKFRSDPFDLERPELLGGPIPTTATTTIPVAAIATITAPNRNQTATIDAYTHTLNRPPTRARTREQRERAESFTSHYSKYSKYSSGISMLSAVENMGEWSDPGPDVGPAAAAAAAAAVRGDQIQLQPRNLTPQSPGQGLGRQGQGQGWAATQVPDGNGVGAVQGGRERLALAREREGSSPWNGDVLERRRMSGSSLGSVGKAM